MACLRCAGHLDHAYDARWLWALSKAQLLRFSGKAPMVVMTTRSGSISRSGRLSLDCAVFSGRSCQGHSQNMTRRRQTEPRQALGAVGLSGRRERILRCRPLASFVKFSLSLFVPTRQEQTMDTGRSTAYLSRSRKGKHEVRQAQLLKTAVTDTWKCVRSSRLQGRVAEPAAGCAIVPVGHGSPSC